MNLYQLLGWRVSAKNTFDKSLTVNQVVPCEICAITLGYPAQSVLTLVSLYSMLKSQQMPCSSICLLHGPMGHIGKLQYDWVSIIIFCSISALSVSRILPFASFGEQYCLCGGGSEPTSILACTIPHSSLCLAQTLGMSSQT